MTIAHTHNQQFVALVFLTFDLRFNYLNSHFASHICKKNVETKLEEGKVIRSWITAHFVTQLRKVWWLLPVDLKIARTCHWKHVHKNSTLWHFLSQGRHGADGRTDRQTDRKQRHIRPLWGKDTVIIKQLSLTARFGLATDETEWLLYSNQSNRAIQQKMNP